MQSNDMDMLFKNGYLLSGGSYKVEGETAGKSHFEQGIKARDISNNKALQFFAKLFNSPLIELNGKVFKLSRSSLKKFIERQHLIPTTESSKSKPNLNTESYVAAIKSHIESRKNPENTEALKRKLTGQASAFALISKIKTPAQFEIKETTFDSAMEALGLNKETIVDIKTKIGSKPSSGTLIIAKEKILQLLESVADKITTKDETLTPFIDVLKKRMTEEQAERASEQAFRRLTLKKQSRRDEESVISPPKPRKLSESEKSEIETLLTRPTEKTGYEQKLNPDKVTSKDIKSYYPQEKLEILLSDADRDIISDQIMLGKFSGALFRELHFKNQIAVALKLAQREDFLFNPAANTVIKEFIQTLSGDDSRLLLCLITSEEYAADEAVQRLNLLLDDKIKKIEESISTLEKTTKAKKITVRTKESPQKQSAIIFSKLLQSLEQFKDLSTKRSETQKRLCTALGDHFQKTIDEITTDAHFMKLSKNKKQLLEKLNSKKKVEEFFKKDPSYATESVTLIATTTLTEALHSKSIKPDEQKAKILQIGKLLDTIPSEYREAIIEDIRTTHKSIYIPFLDAYSKSTNNIPISSLITEVANGSDLQRISSPILVNHIVATLTKDALKIVSLQKLQASTDPALAIQEARKELNTLIQKNPKLIAQYLEPSVTELKKIHEADVPVETLLSVTHKLLLKNVSHYKATSLLDKQLLAYCFDKLSQLRLDGNSAIQFEKLFTAQRDLMAPVDKKVEGSSPLNPTDTLTKPKIANVTKSLGIFSTTRISLTKMIAQLKAIELLDTPAETKETLTETREAFETVLKDLGAIGAVSDNYKDKIKSALLAKKRDADTMKLISIAEIDTYREGLLSGKITLPDTSLDLNKTVLSLDTLINKKFVFSPESERDSLIQSYSTVLSSNNFKKSTLLLDKVFSLLEKQTKDIDLNDTQTTVLKKAGLEPKSRQVRGKTVFSFQPSYFMSFIFKYQAALEPSFKELCEDLSQESERISEDLSISPDKKSLYNSALESAKSAFQAILNRTSLANYKKTLASSK